jgi:hypothetical protein
VETIKQGRLSFPSGHASNSMSLAWFNSLYIIWALYWREGATYPRHVFAAPTFLRRIVAEFMYAVIYGFTLLVLCLSWFIGLTRFWDDLHNISDIIGGFLCALIFTTPTFLAAVGQYNVFQEAMDYDEILRRRHKGKHGPSERGGITTDDTGASSGDVQLPVVHTPMSPAEAARRRYNEMLMGTATDSGAEGGDVVTAGVPPVGSPARALTAPRSVTGTVPGDDFSGTGANGEGGHVVVNVVPSSQHH